MVSIIIVSYNTKKLLQLCLRAIYGKLGHIPVEIIVVDNASTDESVDMIKKEFSKAKLLQNKTNLGFAKAVNIGAKIAKGEYLLFLNSDAHIKDDKIREMIKLLEKNPTVGIIGGELQNLDETTSQSYGSFYTIPQVLLLLFGSRFKKTKLIPISGFVDWVSGGFMLIRRSIFENLAGFDEHFFMYVEDMELCYRAKKRGFATYFFPDAKATHAGQGSSSRSFAIPQIYKGILYFYKKHKSPWQYIVVKVLLLSKAVIAIMIGLFTFNNILIKTYKKAVVLSL